MLCPVCFSKSKKKFDLNKTVVLKCTNCNLEYLKDLKESRDYIYKDGYWIDFNDEKIRKVATKNFSNVLKKILNYKKEGDLLDIGGGNLVFASLASKHFNVTVLDININKIQDKNIKTKVCNFLDCDIKKKYDVITAFSFIEHIPYPHSLFSKVSSLLKKGGLFFVITPNVGSFPSKILRKRWYQYKEEHVVLYSKRSLSLIAEKNNLKILSLNPHFPFISPYYLLKYSDKYSIMGKDIDNVIKGFFSILSNVEIFFINMLSGESLVVFKKL